VHQELLLELKQFSGKLFTKEGRDALKGQFADVDDKVPQSAKDKSKE